MFAHYAFSRRDVTFEAEGATLVGWFYRPQRDGDLPAIVMSHGFACVKELFVDRFAEAFAQAGFAVLLYDHRNFGASGGEPRGEIDPWRQVSDMRDAVTWMTMQPGIDVSRLGLWGSSYSGGHVLTLAAQDRRVACVVAQVPTSAAVKASCVGCRRDRRPRCAVSSPKTGGGACKAPSPSVAG